ncbi:MAG: porin family protein [Acidobacteria bacterium]|nr:porin family protein [Acidobacteriota bacterium]
MRKYLLSAAAVAAVATAMPASARDGSGYVGVEAGLLFPKDTKVRAIGTGTVTYTYYDEYYEEDVEATAPIAGDFSFRTTHRRGIDVDLIAGYDFGAFRLEAELGYKRAKHDEFENVSASYEIDYDGDIVTGSVTDFDIDAGGRTKVLSLMGNALADFGNEDGLSFYAGGGLGLARTNFRVEADGKLFGFKRTGLAWQLIAGARYALGPNTDIGLKYRYFRGNKMKRTDSGPAGLDISEVFDGDVDFNAFNATARASRFNSHSVLASLIFNFGAAPPPPPPPPPAPPPPPEAPATQTCPDGSVIMATDVCPVPPPPPPPPPPPAPVGERG